MATRTIETQLTLTGEKEFNTEMKAVNSNLKTLKSEQSAVASTFDKSGGTLSNHIKLTKNLRDQNKQQQEVIRAATVALKQNIEAYGADSKQADHFRQIIAKAKAEINKNNAELKKHGLSLKNIKSAGDPVIKVLKGIGDAAGKSVKGITGFGTAAAGIATAFTAAAGAAGMAAVSTIASYARESAEAAKELRAHWKPLNATQKQWYEYSKQLDALDASVSGAKSALAGVLLPVLSNLSKDGAAFLNDFSKALNDAAGDSKAQTAVIAEYVGKGAALIKEKLPEYKAVAADLLSGLYEGFRAEGPELLDIAFDLVADILDGIIEAAPVIAEAGTVLLQKLTDALIERGPDLLTGAVSLVAQIVSGLGKAAPDLIPAAANLVSKLVSALLEAAPELLIAGLELVYGLVSGISDGLGEFISSAGDIIDTIAQAFSDAWPEIQSIGKNIVEGIWNGISGSWDWLLGKLRGWVSDVVKVIKDFLGIESPSKVMRDQVGRYMAQGIGVGFEREMDDVNRQIQGSIQTAFDIPELTAPRGFYAAARPGEQAPAKTVELNIYAPVIDQNTMNMIVDTVNQELGDKL